MIDETLKQQINWYDTDQTIAKDEISNYEAYINYMFKDRIKQIDKDIYIDGKPFDMNIDTTKIAEKMFSDIQIKKKTSIKMAVKSLANKNLELSDSSNMTDSCQYKEQEILNNLYDIINEDENIPKSDWELYKEWRNNNAVWNISEKGNKTGIADCFSNIVGFIENFPYTKNKIRFNKIRNIVEYDKRQVVDNDYHTIINLICKYFLPTFSKIKMVKDAVDNVANKNRYNPWIEYFDKLEYKDDGIDYIEYIIKEILHCEWQETYYDYYYAVLRQMLLAEMERIYKTDINLPTKFDVVTCFCSTNGGSGKGTFLEELHDIEGTGNSYCYIVAGDSFQPKDKDFLERSHQCTCLLLDEITMKRAIVTSIKGYITQKDDRFRKAYGFNSESHIRGFIITATSNNKDILKDFTTDNERRWAIIKVTEDILNFNNVKRAFKEGVRDKIWSFIKNIYQKGNYKLYYDDENNLMNLQKSIQRNFKASNNADYNTIIDDLLEREYGYYEIDNKLILNTDMIAQQYLFGDSYSWCKSYNNEIENKKVKFDEGKYIMKPEDVTITKFGKINRIAKKDLYDILNKLKFDWTKDSLNAEIRFSNKWNGADKNKYCRINNNVTNAYWREKECQVKDFSSLTKSSVKNNDNQVNKSDDNMIPF